MTEKMGQQGCSDRAITERVIRVREEAGLTQKELAGLLGLSKQGYSHYESGRGSFTVQHLFRLARILGRPITWFLGIPQELADDEEVLLHLYRQLDEHHKRLYLENLRTTVRILHDTR